MNEYPRPSQVQGQCALHGVAARVNQVLQVDDRQLAIMRIAVGFALLLAPPPPYEWLDQLPAGVFNPPPGLAQLVLSIPVKLPLALLDGIIRVLCLGLLLGIRTRLTGPALALGLLYGNCFKFSLGKIDHNDVILIIALIALSLGSGWGETYAMLPDPRPRASSGQRWGPQVLAACIVVGMASAGFGKLLAWVDFNSHTSGFLAWFRSRENLTLLGQWLGQLPPPIIEAIDYITVGLELSPLAMILLGKRWWKGWLIAANIFHLGVYLSLGISFFYQSMSYLAFTTWTQPIRARKTSRISVLILFAMATAIALIARQTLYTHGLRRELTAAGFLAVSGLQLRGLWLEASSPSQPTPDRSPELMRNS